MNNEMKTQVVIEFSERWLKAVVSLKKTILEPLEGDISNITVALDRIFQEIGRRKGLEVIVCLSRNKITIRRIDLPSQDALEIEQMLGLHVIRQVPYPKEEIIWGYQNLGFDGISNSHILLAIVHRDVLRQIFNAFVSLNILPEAILFSSQGVIHYLSHSLRDKSLLSPAYLILDVDYNFSDLILVHNQNLRSSVIISQGAEQLKLEEERAKFAAELKQAIVVFNNEIPNIKPLRLFLTGTAKDVQVLAEVYLKKDFNLKLNFVESEDVKLKKADGVSFSAILGFAYERKKGDISFVLPEAQIKREIRLKTQQLLTLGVCLVYILVLLGITTLLRLNQLQSYRDKLNIRIAQLKRDSGGLADIAQELNIAGQFTETKQSVLTYIYELNRLCPDNITLTEFSWEWQKNFSIRGTALQLPDVFGFVAGLDGSASFKGAQARNTRRHKVKDKEIVDFEIARK